MSIQFSVCVQRGDTEFQNIVFWAESVEVAIAWAEQHGPVVDVVEVMYEAE